MVIHRADKCDGCDMLTPHTFIYVVDNFEVCPDCYNKINRPDVVINTYEQNYETPPSTTGKNAGFKTTSREEIFNWLFFILILLIMFGPVIYTLLLK